MKVHSVTLALNLTRALLVRGDLKRLYEPRIITKKVTFDRSWLELDYGGSEKLKYLHPAAFRIQEDEMPCNIR